MQADIAKLRELLAKATPGPWESDTIQNEGNYGDGGPDCKTGFKSYAIYGAAGLALLDSLNSESAVVHEETDEDRHYAWDEVARRNFALIAAMHEALPELLAIAEAVEAARPVMLTAGTLLQQSDSEIDRREGAALLKHALKLVPLPDREGAK